VHGVIPSSKVSRQHCKVLIGTGGFYVCDLESANGTFLNGVQVAANRPELLRDGDILKLADVEFKVTI
jgi:pSer/pThr/pTyr-binding forkhead associated (FHA) protein